MALDILSYLMGGSGGKNGKLLVGSAAPADSLGADGDVYKRTMPLPENVHFVEYLESAGDAQYINTGIYATQDIDAIVTADRRSGNSNEGCAFGVRTGSYTSMSKTLYFGSHSDNAGGLSVIKTGSANDGTTIKLTGVSTRRTKTIRDKNGAYVYWATIDEYPSYSKLYRQTGTWTSDMPLCMFGFYNGTTLNCSASVRVMRVTILDKGSPIADYLPCLDASDVPCMWENVSGTYVYNTGTGTFLYGSSATPEPLEDVYYIKRDGSWEVLS